MKLVIPNIIKGIDNPNTILKKNISGLNIINLSKRTLNPIYKQNIDVIMNILLTGWE